MSIDDFIRSNLLAVKRGPATGKPDASTCLRVDRVIPRSVAGSAAIRKGDLLVFVGGQPAATAGEDYWAVNVPERVFTFYSPASNERSDLKASGVEIGMTLAPTADAVVKRYDGDPGDLESLWEDGEWKPLIDLASKTIGPAGSGDQRDHPALALFGAGLYEIGAPDQGFQLIREYYDNYVSHWTTNYAAICLYYLGREYEKTGRRDEAIGVLREAWETSESERIGREVERLTGSLPSRPPQWVGKRFPVGYRLRLLEARGDASLPDTLREMPDGKLLVVCMLASYRANGPYNQFMRKYIHCATHFRDFVHGLHVITMETERRPDRAQWFDSEDEAKRLNLPVTLLHDSNGSVTNAISPQGSPFILMVDRKGVIRYEGWFEIADLWGTLAGLS